MDHDPAAAPRTSDPRVARGEPARVPDEVRRRAESLAGGPVSFVDLGVADRFVALGTEVVVRLASTADAAEPIRRETARLRWAATHGVPVPPVLESAPGLQVTRREPDDPHVGTAFADAVIGALASLAAAPPVPEDLREPADRTRSLRERIIGVARLAARGVDLRSFRSAQAAVADLPDEVAVHGDLNHENVLFDAASGQVKLIDWELTSVGPRGHDLLTLWPQVADPEARARLLDAVREWGIPTEAIATQLRWSAQRQLADLIHEGRADRTEVQRARSAVAEAEATATSL